jgi:hypothetical protein
MASLPHPSSCPTCGCGLHAGPPRTWEVRCFVCRELRWPYQVDEPGPFWTCRRCQATGPEKRAERVDVARRGAETRRQKAPVTSSGARGAPLAAQAGVW